MSNTRCFIDAVALWRASGSKKISDEEYHRIMLVHFEGIRHPYDRIAGDTLSVIDSFASSLQKLIFENKPIIVDGKSFIRILHDIEIPILCWQKFQDIKPCLSTV